MLVTQQLLVTFLLTLLITLLLQMARYLKESLSYKLQLTPVAQQLSEV